jgi:hypothetical protein
MGKEAEDSLKRMTEGGVTFTEVDRKPFIDKMQAWYASQDLPEGFMEAVEATRVSN